MSHKFLSDGWFKEVIKIRDEAGDLELPEDAMKLVINLRITDGPEGEVKCYFKGGTVYQGKDGLAGTNVTITYPLARKMIMEMDIGAVMKGLMTRKVKVKGDLTKLMPMTKLLESPKIQTLMGNIQAMTEDD